MELLDNKTMVEETQTPEFKGKENIKELALKELNSLVYMDNVKEILKIALATEENVILYGPGGFGKSESSLAFFRAHDIDPYIITMGTGMTTDRLFGGMNIPKFQSEGKIEYLVENSFMEHEYVIFEELFDAPDFILEQLKDIISSGVFRNGNQVFPIKTKLIICCTNRDRTEFAKNTSLKALMERFPLETKVDWKNYNQVTYSKLLKTKLGFVDEMLVYILEEFAKTGINISPRIALKAANIIKECGPSSLAYIADFSSKPDVLKTCINKFEGIAKINKLVEQMAQLSKDYTLTNKTDLMGVKEATAINQKIKKALVDFEAIKAPDHMVKLHVESVKLFKDIIAKNTKELTIQLVVDDIMEDVMKEDDNTPF